MPGKNRYPLVGWHSRRPELVAAARAEAERRGITLAALLDEALEAFLRPAAEVTAAAAPAQPEVTARPPRKARAQPAARQPGGKCKHEHAVKGWCRECRTGGH